VPLLARTVSAPISIEIRSGAIESLAPLLADGRVSSGGEVAIAVGTGQGEAVAEAVGATLPDAPLMQVQGASMDSALALIAELRTSYFDAVVGIGGGKTLDVAKYAASMVGLPFVSVATNLSHDGIASPVSVLDSHGRKSSFGVHIPIAVVVDLDFVRASPPHHTRSGIGDVASNLSAVADWQLAARARAEPIDGLAVTLARTAAEAVINQEADLDSETFLTTLAEGLFLSGMAMSVAGSSRPCSGGCHEVSHAIDALFPETALHGEQVAVGTLFASFLRDDPSLAAIDRCFRRHGLPRLPADLGLSVEEFTQAVLAAPTTRPDRYTILEHLDLDPRQARERVQAFIDALDR
jgi:glycerol-1-phosphate dehydrogenase [NAD(P)+]